MPKVGVTENDAENDAEDEAEDEACLRHLHSPK